MASEREPPLPIPKARACAVRTSWVHAPFQSEGNRESQLFLGESLRHSLLKTSMLDLTTQDLQHQYHATVQLDTILPDRLTQSTLKQCRLISAECSGCICSTVFHVDHTLCVCKIPLKNTSGTEFQSWKPLLTPSLSDSVPRYFPALSLCLTHRDLPVNVDSEMFALQIFVILLINLTTLANFHPLPK
jgi:hypothetical protein